MEFSLTKDGILGLMEELGLDVQQFALLISLPFNVVKKNLVDNNSMTVGIVFKKHIKAFVKDNSTEDIKKKAQDILNLSDEIEADEGSTQYPRLTDEEHHYKIREIKVNGKVIEHHHMDLLMSIASQSLPVWIFGEAGSGKSTAAELIAKRFNLPFYFISVCPTTSESKLLGYKDAMGVYQDTPFRKAYEQGGVFLLDEADNGNPSVMSVLNGAIANKACAFPDAIVNMHENFRIVAAANTIGNGGDIIYIGRSGLDGATKDRFCYLRWDIDLALEAAMIALTETDTQKPKFDKGGPLADQHWLHLVRDVRKAVNDLGVKILITTRATKYGSMLLHQGMGLDHVCDIVIWKGINPNEKKRILKKVKSNAEGK